MHKRLSDAYIVNANGCWVWQPPLNWGGYGTMTVNGTRHPAHRAVYLLLGGPIPDGYDLDHLCHTRDQTCPGGTECPHRACINPEHLEPVTRSENLQRGDVGGWWQRQKTTCPQGHPYDEANTHARSDKPGRNCRQCHREANLAYYRRKRASL